MNNEIKPVTREEFKSMYDAVFAMFEDADAPVLNIVSSVIANAPSNRKQIDVETTLSGLETLAKDHHTNEPHYRSTPGLGIPPSSSTRVKNYEEIVIPKEGDRPEVIVYAANYG